VATGTAEARLGVDIGGTFTDVALEIGDRRYSAKTLTTPEAPERAVLDVTRLVIGEAGLQPGDLSIIIHGTTLATNAIIERKGAKTALVTTEGFRDTIEIRHENRFEQYDVNIDLPPPLVPRRLRFVVPERINAQGRVIVPLDEETVARLADRLAADGVESVAVGFLHSFTNPAHEQRTGELLAARLSGVTFTLSSEVSPEMREYERFSTACANAYVQPMMGRYLINLEGRLRDAGFGCPLFLMLSGGGLTTVETAVRFPVRLVESGPAGGAIFASHIARQCGLDKVLSYDMGGTTAKICLIDDLQPQTSRAFEVARIYRFKKGSGLPLRIPVIDMVEIGAGGGSIARVDRLKRITVGPDSAGADPGPACYGRGGAAPTVTDADLMLGRIDPTGFSGGRMALDRAAADSATQREIAEPLDLALPLAAFGVSEIVDENMANAARVHAIESGKDARGRTLVAFGGAAPLHAARLAEKLGLDRVLVPSNAGVGSAVGFLRAPIAY
jgi:N-methylhydantoinase A